MKARVTLFSTLFILGAAPALTAQLYGPDFGMSSPIVASGNQVIATYLGWERTTVFGDQIYALTAVDYTNDLANGCFGFSAASRTTCLGGSNVDLGGLAGLDLFGRPYGVSCPVADPTIDPCLSSPVIRTFGWTPGTEIIFALMVDQGQGEYNWFFSGDPSRNNVADGFDGGHAHLAWFPSSTYANGVPTYDPNQFVPGTAGLSVFGFEDVSYHNSDWDFNNAIFALDADTIEIPESATPEPATMSLLATGLITLGAASLRRRRGAVPTT